jgi:hypothetical protein
MLQKLTVVGTPLANKPEVDCIVAALAATSCHVQGVDFQVLPHLPNKAIDLGIVERLFSVFWWCRTKSMQVLRGPWGTYVVELNTCTNLVWSTAL